MNEERLCQPCEVPITDKLPPCPLQCKSPKCKSYKKRAPIDSTKTPIVWILGGPGSGKGTQCDKIIAKYGFIHLSTGDLLREEVRSGSERAKCLTAIMERGVSISIIIFAKYGFIHVSTGDLLREEVRSGSERANCLTAIMERGELVPNDLVLDLLKEAMLQHAEKARGFLIDGYPREKSQGIAFEQTIAPATSPQANSSSSISTRDIGPSVRILQINIEGISAAKMHGAPSPWSLSLNLPSLSLGFFQVLVLFPSYLTKELEDPTEVIIYFEAKSETLTKRLLGRAVSSGRADDNEETIKLRLKTFLDNNDQVLAQYPDKLRRINAEQSVDAIFGEVQKILDPIVARAAA
ncbi:hypothetical protein MSG28_001982 [Choristoneura fumiferana]|uniref:Uncharacterized protein n=1 Tax=Choristoneura fumiferana TaxID=7141 RepID=A0ACC0JTD5_CHOFU|nr:hypothetical protein MSG28_001982 [Choristoneura fumiferana]